MNKDFDTLKDIEELIKNEIPESTYLEYKGAEALSKSEGKKKEISKDVCAFANADGGILIYGVGEHDNLPRAIEFIDTLIFSSEWLDQIIHSNIQRKIQGLKIISILNSKNQNECIFVLKIPRSIDAPHLAKTGKFHIRRNFHVQEMEEYEIREAYKRTASVELNDLRLIPTKFGEFIWDNNTHHYMIFKIMVNNIGGAIEEDFKLKIYSELPFVEIEREVKGKDYTEAFNCSIGENMGMHEYEILGKTKIFQDEQCTILDKWRLRFHKKNVEDFFHLKIHLVLYYSQGVLKNSYQIKDLLRTFM